MLKKTISLVLCMCILHVPVWGAAAQGETDWEENRVEFSETAGEKIVDKKDFYTDRFIVKRSSEEIGALSEGTDLEATVVETIQALKQEDLVINSEGLSLQQQSLENGIVVEAIGEQYQCLTLDAMVEAEDFVSKVQEKAGDQIMYIQPDYQLELAADIQSVEAMPIENKSIWTDISEDEEDKEKQEEDILPKQDDEVIQEEKVITEEEQPEETSVKNAVVALIDSGVDIMHPMLEARIVNPWNMIQNVPMAYDADRIEQYYHGTHIAGVIAQTAPEARIMPIQVFENGTAYTSDILKGIEYAKENGADIVNCSWGSTENNPVLEEAIKESGLLFVCAAGNNRINVDETPVYPACFELDNIISTAALNSDQGFSYFSNYGINSVDIAAPGRDVESAFPEGKTGKLSGTSVAAGAVSGAAALALSIESGNPKEYIFNTADKLSNLTEKVAQSRSLSLSNLLQNIPGTEQMIFPADDFDVHGYQPFPEEAWTLFASLKNIQTAAGEDFTLALKADGTVWSWGNNEHGQLGRDGSLKSSGTPAMVTGLKGIIAIDAGPGHGVALKEDGTVYAWGDNTYGQLGDGTKKDHSIPVQVAEISGVKKISAGRIHTAAITEDGSVYIWGNNNRFQLGTGNSKEHIIPVQIDLPPVKDIAAGGSHTIAAAEDGTVYVWGNNAYGQLGDGTKKDRVYPVAISGINNIKNVAAGLNKTGAVTEDGTIYLWGEGGSVTPEIMNGLPQIAQLSIGKSHIAAIASGGQVYTWGDNAYGKLGDGTMETKSEPVLIAPLTEVLSISAGGMHTAAVTNDGNIYTWGFNGALQLGIDNECSAEPLQVYGLKNIKSVSAGMYHSLGVSEEGTLYSWGYNSHGQLGIGSKNNSDTPVEVEGLPNVQSAAAGYYHSAAVTEDGTVYAWGNNQYGQLGSLEPANALTPMKVEGLEDIVMIAAGAYHTLALKSDGTVYAWGRNHIGQIGNGTETDQWQPVQVDGLSDITAVAAGYYSSYALTADGRVYSWGSNQFGQLGDKTHTHRYTPIDTGMTDIASISAGMNHIITLSNTGIAYTWGNNSEGQLGIGTMGTENYGNDIGLRDLCAVTAGQNHNFAIREDGTVYAWGSNAYYQSGNGAYDRIYYPAIVSGITEIKSIQAGYGHNLAVKADGTVIAWGNNGSGQLGDGGRFCRTTPYLLDGRINESLDDPWDVLPVSMGIPAFHDLDPLRDTDWYIFTCPYTTECSFQVTPGFHMELYDMENQPLGEYGETIQKKMQAGEAVYIKVLKTDDGTGEYTLYIEGGKTQDSNKAHPVTVNSDLYYLNLHDGGRLYWNSTPITGNAVRSLCADENAVYFAMGSGIYQAQQNVVAQLASGVTANFLATDGEFIYFSRWDDGGKIYALNISTGAMEKICGDAGTWLYLDREYIYYYNIYKSGEIYKILKSERNVDEGERE